MVNMGSAEVARFIPSDMRVRIVQDLIAEIGIRPLSNAIGVNSKTVYKYKHGIAHPTDETMTRILTIMEKEHPELFEKYATELRESFLAVVGSTPLQKQALPEPKIAPKKPKKKPRRKILAFLRLRR